jgi:aryl-alcohol dehydrogenase-like predicted oxidoreductase
MRYRPLGSTGLEVSEVSFGAWAIGGSWGAVDDGASREALHRAIDRGVNFIDTADVYGDGRSERLIGEVLSSRRERVLVATKAGRRLNPHEARGYTLENLRRFVDRSRENLRTPALDLLQLHCPPSEVYRDDRVFDALDTLVSEGRIARYGVSVETCDEALEVLATRPRVASLQIILNALRLKPLARVLPEARARGVGILARVPLASGLLTGKIARDAVFAPDDHRAFNRHGEAFDVGETFSGVPLEAAFEAVDALREVLGPGDSMARFALAWCLAQPGVSCVIPGARSAAQVDENVGAMDFTITDEQRERVRAVYERVVAPHVAHRW